MCEDDHQLMLATYVYSYLLSLYLVMYGTHQVQLRCDVHVFATKCTHHFAACMQFHVLNSEL